MSVPMNVPIVLNALNKEDSYARTVMAIYSNDRNELKLNRSLRVEPQPL